MEPHCGAHPRELSFANGRGESIVGMKVDEGLRQMLDEPRRATGSRHGVPLVADSTRVENERMRLIRRVSGWPLS